MKIDPRETAARIADAARAWPEGLRLILLHGADAAAAADHAARLARAFTDDTGHPAVTDVSGDTVKDDPQALAGAVAERSMFGDAVLVRCTGAGDDAVPAVAAVLADAPGNPLVIVATSVKKGSPLVALAEKSPAAWAIACYEPTARDAVSLVGGIAGEAGLRPTQAAARTIFEAAQGDRATIRQEIAKLALYLDPPPAGGTRAVEGSDVAAIGAGTAEGDWDALVSVVAGGDGRAVAALLPRLDARGEGGIGALRAMQRRIWLLAGLRDAVDRGQPVDAAVKAARVFWKEADAVAAQVRRWPAGALRDAASRILAAERAIKASGSAGEVIAAQTLLQLARGRG